MCGVAGKIDFKGQAVDGDLLCQMTSYLQERGPDITGYYTEKNIGLGHTRLSIIDLSELGHQPMSYLDVVLVFNGEIYNYQLLRKELIEDGASFKSSSDTEVLILGYRHWGIDKLLAKLDGMFAFALYDKLREQCFIARDPFGKKPLYYYHDQSEFLFASDIRSIWGVAKNKLNFNHHALDYYLAEITCPQPYTIWEKVFQVKPGHYYVLNTTHSGLKEFQYYNPKFSNAYSNVDETEVVELTEDLLTKAIMKRSIADVDIGCFLSGGIDSGLISAIYASQSSKPINTYTVGFEVEAYNEIPNAQVVADRYHTNHENIILNPIAVEDVVDLIEYFGEPFADSSAIPTYMISKAIGKHVKVALSGDGGDEGFGGYDQYVLASKANKFALDYKSPLAKAIITPIDKILSRINPKKDNYGSLNAYLQWPGEKRLLRDIGFCDQNRADLLCESTDFTAKYLREIWESEVDFHDPVNRLMRASLKTRLLNDYLVKVDRASMKNSLEVRSPFLDKHLMDFALNLPTKILFKNGQSKYLLKRLAEKYIAPDVASRPKMGFGIPLGQWLRNEYQSLIDEYLKTSRFIERGFFNYNFVTQLLEEHISQKANHGTNIWSLICFEIWCRKFLD
ncbi:asparagine synthase (glutamine-hydrolyzing) [Marinoscillum furvescens]|uniref:asparagine synthase (glutamine-hydrolyzing) n=1 Tax=Marinoscillum furvescens DSM 4134 TaxID=1122208 RepID=A0A3D9L333_MARFU|nr:asparagine synthase (glutamine-hydrolyzing) [Marinoscillum furvescens]RED99557.1 asparagine synthase (glutamine-hydrolysing) [Marinoscillum furvescens DSM 4134]